MVALPRLLLLLFAAAPSAEAGIEASVAAVMGNFPVLSELPDDEVDQEGIRKQLGWTRERMRVESRSWDRAMMIEHGHDGVEAPVEVRVRNDLALITPLSRHTFDDNVVKERAKEGELLVEHWVVEFCVHWWEPCQEFSTHFDDIGQRLTEELNADLAVNKRVNFARVNCATDKVLCNEQAVEDYPTVRHYYRGEAVGTWRRGKRKGDHERLFAWVAFELKERLWGEEKDRKEDKPFEFPFEWREVAATLVAAFGCCWALWGIASGPRRQPGPAQPLGPAARPSAPAAQELVAPAPASTTRLLPNAWVEERKEVEL